MARVRVETVLFHGRPGFRKRVTGRKSDTTYRRDDLFCVIKWRLLFCAARDALGTGNQSISDARRGSSLIYLPVFLVEASIPVVEVSREIDMSLLVLDKLRKAVVPFIVLLDCCCDFDITGSIRH